MTETTTSPVSETVQYRQADGIATIRITRPEKRNALTQDMYMQLTQALQQADAQASVRVVLLQGSDGFFCSGNDLGDFVQAMQDHKAESEGQVVKEGDLIAQVRQFLQTLSRFPKPLVAAVEGPAVGIGTTMLLHCDLVYAAQNTRFQLPFVNLGLTPEGGSSAILPAMLGHQRAAELLLLGEPFSADEALAMGLINRVVADDAVITVAQEQASKLAAKAPAALLAAKAMLRNNSGKPISTVLQEEIDQFVTQLHSPEAAEALDAFLSRRPANFQR